MDELVFTPAGLLSLLTQIEELKDLELSIEDTGDRIVLSIGDSKYIIDGDAATEVEVDDDAIDRVADVNESTYEDLADSADIELTEVVESGILKELAKSLMVGGMLRLTTSILRD